MFKEIAGGSIETKVEQKIGTVEFFHPMSNSLPGLLLEELAMAITQMGLDPNVHVIILRSKGEKTFCAGASFDELIQIDTEEQGLKFFSGFAKVINAIRKAPKLVLAVIQGKAVGGGVGIAAAADYAFAHESASVKLSELAVGIGPFVVGPVVERKIGMSAFSELAIDASNWRTARWGADKGLYAEIYPSHEELEAGVQTMANKLAASSPDAMAALKKIFWEGTEHWDEFLIERAKISGRLVLSDFTKEFITKFKNKGQSRHQSR